MKKIIVASTVVIGASLLGATAQASTLGDYVNYGRVPLNSTISCTSAKDGCEFDVRDTTTVKTTRVYVTYDAKMNFCESAGVPTVARVSTLNLNRIMVAQTRISVIWSPWNAYSRKVGAVTCKE